MKTILILVNHEIVIYNFRRELVERLLSEGYEVVISSPGGSKIDQLVALGCTHFEVDIDRHGKNIIEEIKLIKHYFNLMRKIKPDVVLSYTIKPNLYGGLVTRLLNIPLIANITGLGNAIETQGVLQKIVILLYKLAFAKVSKVYFQNNSNMAFFKENKIVTDKHELLPGSGVNLNHFRVLPYPDDPIIDIIYISRIMKSKGIDEFLHTAREVKKTKKNINFHIYGFVEGDYELKLKDYEKKEIVMYHGMISDVREALTFADCVVLPSYHEGMSNVLLEAAASGRPILASNIPGCRETFDEGISGLGFESKNAQSLIDATFNFLALSQETRKRMGLAGRLKMEKEFSREIIVDKYMSEIYKL